MAVEQMEYIVITSTSFRIYNRSFGVVQENTFDQGGAEPISGSHTNIHVPSPLMFLLLNNI